MNVVLMQPEIPQNTGNIARTCSCTGCALHLVRPMGFQLTQRNLRRAGMDYFDDVELTVWNSNEEFLEAHGGDGLVLFTGSAQVGFAQFDYTVDSDNLFLVFGRESAGIDPEILERFPQRCVRIPMIPGRRSLNLANSVAIAVYEALRQNGYPGLV